MPTDEVRSEVPPEVVELINRMFLLAPQARPAIAEVHATLMKVRTGGPRSATPEAEVSGPKGVSGLKGKGLRTTTRPADATFAGTPAPTAGVAAASVVGTAGETPTPPSPAMEGSGPDEGKRPKSSLLGKLVGKVRKTDRP